MFASVHVLFHAKNKMFEERKCFLTNLELKLYLKMIIDIETVLRIYIEGLEKFHI